MSMPVHRDEPLLERYVYLEERELDLEVVCRRGCEELFAVRHRDFPQFKKNPVNPTLIIRGSAWI
jgi:hypothetical protein